jgi:hypothetical protein
MRDDALLTEEVKRSGHAGASLAKTVTEGRHASHHPFHQKDKHGEHKYTCKLSKNGLR